MEKCLLERPLETIPRPWKEVDSKGAVTMVYKSRNYWVFGLCPSFGILKIREHNVSETGSVSFLRSRGGEGRHLLSWIP
jgi:hypothetical protein